MNTHIWKYISTLILLIFVQIISAKYSKKKSKDHDNNEWHKHNKKTNSYVSSDSKVLTEVELKYMNNIKNDINRKSKVHIKKKKAASFLQMKRAITDLDAPSIFFDPDTFLNNIKNLPLNGQVQNTPWSSYYWPAKYGSISARYNLNDKNSMGNFDSNFNNFTSYYNFTTSIYFYSQPEEYNYLINTFNTSTDNNLEKYINEVYSPSEKYDYLIGDLNFTLTNFLKQSSLLMADQFGYIPDWFGSTNGWSVASSAFAKPQKEVVVTASDGATKIHFLPTDIEALAIMYCSSVEYKSNFVGGVCSNSEETANNIDSNTGLYTSDDCFEINPGTFLITIANQVGLKNKSMTINPYVSPEIWNQPVINYALRYFNVISNTFSDNLNDAMTDFRTLATSNDSFLKFMYTKADNLTKTVFGVAIDVTYATWSYPYHTTSPTLDFNNTETYVAVIELDEGLNIIGGEWKYNNHPNFVWRNDDNYPVHGCCDILNAVFDGKFTADIVNSAIQASQSGQIIRTIVDFLINNSKQDNILSSSSSNSISGLNSNDNIVNNNPVTYLPVNTPTIPTTITTPAMPTSFITPTSNTPSTPSTPINIVAPGPSTLPSTISNNNIFSNINNPLYNDNFFTSPYNNNNNNNNNNNGYYYSNVVTNTATSPIISTAYNNIVDNIRSTMSNLGLNSTPNTLLGPPVTNYAGSNGGSASSNGIPISTTAYSPGTSTNDFITNTFDLISSMTNFPNGGNYFSNSNYLDD